MTKTTTSSKRWTKKDVTKLMRLIKESSGTNSDRIKKVLESFPGRTYGGLSYQYYHNIDKKKTKKAVKKAVLKSSKNTVNRISTKVSNKVNDRSESKYELIKILIEALPENARINVITAALKGLTIIK